MGHWWKFEWLSVHSMQCSKRCTVSLHLRSLVLGGHISACLEAQLAEEQKAKRGQPISSPAQLTVV